MHATGHPPLFGILANRELRECTRCGTRFVGWNWHSRCRDCYRRTSPNPDQARPAPDVELKRIKGELEAVRLELAQRQRALQDTAAKAAELERARATLKTPR